MQLNALKPQVGSKKRRMRVGRGIGSTKGKTCGRGGKGQTARTGVRINGFEGGQTPIHRRLPKRGFNQPNRKQIAVVNTGMIQKAIDAGTLDAKKSVDLAALKAALLIRSNSTLVKLLAKGALKTKVSLAVDFASTTAKEAVEKAGGSVTLPAAPAAA
jgi:large subunit ribosomal protein L15